jgi:hypothetical protein
MVVELKTLGSTPKSDPVNENGLLEVVVSCPSGEEGSASDYREADWTGTRRCAVQKKGRS